MGIFSMLIRSIISYSVFLVSKKIVKGGIGAGNSIRKSLKLHRCTNCWRLYSGDITECDFCGAFVKPLYETYEEMYYQEDEEPDRREGLDKQIYNDSRKVQYKPLNIKNKRGSYDKRRDRAS